MNQSYFEHSGYTSRNRDCFAPGCMNSTREGKPFCSKHVEMHPYIQEVVALINSRATELSDIAKGRHVKEDSSLFEEIIVHITNLGPKTIERLARDLMISIPVIKKLIKTMKKQKLIRIGRSKRGSTVVEVI